MVRLLIKLNVLVCVYVMSVITYVYVVVFENRTLRRCLSGVDHVNVCDKKCNSVCQDGECKCNVCAVVCEDSCSCKVQPSLKDIRERQLRDPGLRTYIKYLEDKELPCDEGTARRLVVESKMFEMIDGILHRESPSVPGRYVWLSHQS